jgi:hypothetical protein
MSETATKGCEVCGGFDQPTCAHCNATKVQHTPGPWHRRIGREGHGGPLSQEEQLCSDAGIGALVITHDGSPEGNANACLAAAAPELVEALKLARLYIPTGSNANMSLAAKDHAKNVAKLVDAALAKAGAL